MFSVRPVPSGPLSFISLSHFMQNNYAKIILIVGHPKTKAFIAHGGTNGIYEAIYHGIPIVGIPLFADQPENINHMVAKGAAIRVDFSTLSTTELLTALRTVINDPS